MSVKGEKLVYNILTIIFLVVFIVGIVLCILKFGKVNETGIWDKVKGIGLTSLFVLIPAYVYSIVIIVALWRWGQYQSDKLVGTIGSLIVPGILPFFYYVFSLRKTMGEELEIIGRHDNPTNITSNASSNMLSNAPAKNTQSKQSNEEEGIEFG
jgi:hypothetical protein